MYRCLEDFLRISRPYSLSNINIIDTYSIKAILLIARATHSMYIVEIL